MICYHSYHYDVSIEEIQHFTEKNFQDKNIQ